MPKKKTKEEFIKRAREVHGDKYDYSKVVYINNHTKVKIICPIHGEFEKCVSHHLQGQGCNTCGNNRAARKQSLTRDEFIKRAREVYGDFYDYSEVVYINYITKVKIICPIHGEFEVLPPNHLNNHRCNKCAGGNYSKGQIEWLEWRMVRDKCFIQHSENIGEKVIEHKNGKYKLDGFCIKTQIAYEYDGDNTPVITGSALGALNGEADWVGKIGELMDAVDAYIEEPVRDNEKPFLMPIEDVFTITGRGTVATGRIETGVANTGDAVDIIGMGAEKLASTITGVEMFRKILNRGEAGDNVGILLRGIEKTDIRRGMVICKPGSVTPHTKFKAEVYILKKEEGGRHTPFHNKYRPQFYIRTTDVTGEILLPDGVEMVMPGDNLTITVELINGVAMSEGLRFAIREGGRTVRAGQITSIIE